LSGTLSGWTKSGDVYTFQGNSAARFNVFTTSGYHPEIMNFNHSQLATRGYMQDDKDWRDIEMTAYVNLTASADDQFVMYARGGRHNDDNAGCEGFAYKADLDFNGDVRIAKEQWHVSYVFGSYQDGMGAIEGKWVGMKSVFYNNVANTEVTLEIWLDPNADNNWTKVLTYVDKGGFGSDGGHCGGEPDQVGVWGGPVATFRWDNVDTIQMKWFSVREIDPRGVFTDGGTDPGGGTGQGGGGGTGTGGGGGTGTGTGGGHIVCTDNPVVVVPGGENLAGDCTKTLYKLTGQSLIFDEGDFETRHYASGKPDTITKEWNADCDWENICVMMYITISDPDDEEDTIAVKFYGDGHDDGEGAWYIFNIQFNNGKCGWGWEQPHPTTASFTDVGDSIGSIIGKKIGLQILVWKKGSGAHCESWVDTGDGKWRKTTTVDNPGGKQFSVDSSAVCTIRIDAAPNIDMECTALKEITPNGEFTGNTSGGTTTGGGQTCVFIPDDESTEEPPEDTTSGTPSGSGGGNQNEPRPIMTVSRDWTFITNVGIDTDDMCTQGNPLEARQFVSLYNVSGEEGIYRDLGYTVNFGEATTEVGVYVNTVRSVLYNQVIKKVTVNGIKRTVDAFSESCTGTLFCIIRNFVDGQIKVQFTEEVNVAGIDVNEQTLDFTKLDNNYVMKVGDMLMLYYQSDDANAQKCLKVKATTKDTFDSINTYLIGRVYDGLFGNFDMDMGFNIFTQ
jgi:hypothetical protein